MQQVAAGRRAACPDGPGGRPVHASCPMSATSVNPTLMNRAFEADLRRAEEECAREPIHRPGAIQPAGMLYVLDAATGAVRGRSVNARPLAEADLAGLRAAIAAAAAAPQTAGEVATVDGARWTASLHRADPATVLLELEPCEDRDGAARALDHLGDTIDALAGAADIVAAAGAAAGHLRAMTGFDRVMVYRFAPDWSGEVIAESLAEGGGGPAIDSFGGLRFPASDIPAQARALYRANRVRLIADAASGPVALETDRPDLDLANLDLGRATLRAVSPVHLAYLANMGVRASMSVAISHVGDKGGHELWGLLACHHMAGPLPVGHRARQAAETLGRALAWRIAELETTETATVRSRLAGLTSELARALADPEARIGRVLAPLGEGLREAAGSGAFLILDAGETLFGATGAPAVPGPGTLADALAAAADGDGGFETDRTGAGALGEAGTELAAMGWCGLLARRVVVGSGVRPDSGPAPGDVWAVWLRREFRHEVVWAGDPAKNIGEAALGAQPALSPRRSFAAWRELVAGRSAPFGPAHRAGADLMREALREALLRRAQAMAAALDDARRRNEAIRFFADAAVHDLREPLWQIQVFAGALREDLQATSESGELAAVIETSAGRMRGMLDDLADFATADLGVDSFQPVALATVVAEAVQDMGEQLRAGGGAIAVALSDLPPVRGDAARLRRVFQNLFSNAIKYRRAEVALRIEVTGERDGAEVRCTVADNGVGFDREDRERIFEPFLRLDQQGAARAQGLGLGLAICRRIVEGHGGSISADAAPGQGARFELILATEGVSA